MLMLKMSFSLGANSTGKCAVGLSMVCTIVGHLWPYERADGLGAYRALKLAEKLFCGLFRVSPFSCIS